ncbi:hypothetical protein GQ55_9G068900 [Panicum hallii var. hallii]|uniref:Uncharacterized protein n=1 Tax=Panicum hallii var. hallii TaxID=1504633 RepID=A0A2T7C0S4_9POAL|nr:hypothetical protein GQ55_9G068900 [Panicum hallii var. hallii]
MVYSHRRPPPSDGAGRSQNPEPTASMERPRRAPRCGHAFLPLSARSGWCDVRRTHVRRGRGARCSLAAKEWCSIASGLPARRGAHVPAARLRRRCGGPYRRRPYYRRLSAGATSILRGGWPELAARGRATSARAEQWRGGVRVRIRRELGHAGLRHTCQILSPRATRTLCVIRDEPRARHGYACAGAFGTRILKLAPPFV